MKYYLLTNLGYDGIMVEAFDDKNKAQLAYEASAKETNVEPYPKNYGVALIEGTLIASKDFEF